MEKKKLLFVINTLSRAGAETALKSLLGLIDKDKYDIDLYVMMSQGEMKKEFAENANILNKKFSEESVLSKEGRNNMLKIVFSSAFKNLDVFKRFPYLLKVSAEMIKNKRFNKNQLLWRLIADGAERYDKEYDLAVAYIEGGSAYYVADYVKAKKKVGFVHIDYLKAGYTRYMDQDCFLKFDQIYTVSDEIKPSFLKVYPEMKDKTGVFHNILDIKEIKRKAMLEGGFSKEDDCFNILTVGRLNPQKAFEISVDAMKILKDEGIKVRWTVLGEGQERKMLENKIKALNLQNDFILKGAVDNPYPYYRTCDLYVHCSRYEGKSIAIQEAQILGCGILVSDCEGNKEQVVNNVDGIITELNAKNIAREIKDLLTDKEKRERLAEEAGKKYSDQSEELKKLLAIVD